MVNAHQLNNALGIALEEVADDENITLTEFKDMRKRLNGLLDQLQEECEDPEMEDE